MTPAQIRQELARSLKRRGLTLQKARDGYTIDNPAPYAWDRERFKIPAMIPEDQKQSVRKRVLPCSGCGVKMETRKKDGLQRCLVCHGGKAARQSKYTEEVVEQMRAEVESGMSRQEVARKYGLSPTHLWNLLTGKRRPKRFCSCGVAISRGAKHCKPCADALASERYEEAA